MPTPEEAIRQIEIDGRWIAGGNEPTPRSLAFATMWYVHPRISGTANLLLKATHSEAHNWQEALRLGAGLCRAQAQSMAGLLTMLGVKARTVGLWYLGDRTHLVVEVEWDDRPHLFDPTWEVWYERDGEILSMAEVAALADPRAILHRGDPLNPLLSSDPIDYLVTDRRVTYNGWGKPDE